MPMLRQDDSCTSTWRAGDSTTSSRLSRQTSETRVLPESLRTGYDKLKSVWPG